MSDWFPLSRTPVSTPDTALVAGQYRRIPRSHLHGDALLAMVCCPVCKKNSVLSRKVHSVDARGYVYPAFMCPYACEFNRWIFLNEWVPEAQGSA